MCIALYFEALYNSVLFAKSMKSKIEQSTLNWHERRIALNMMINVNVHIQHLRNSTNSMKQSVGDLCRAIESEARDMLH